jgi:general secretion pathway protein G
MSLFRSIGLIAIAAILLLAESPDQTRANEAALKNSLLILRQAIDTYTLDSHKAPQTLQDLIARRYLGSIPADPTTSTNYQHCYSRCAAR